MNFESQLICHLVDPKEMGKAWGLGLRISMFNEVLERDIYKFIEAYWLEEHRALCPTVEVLRVQYPTFVYKEPTESLAWLFRKVKEAYARRKTEDLLHSAATKMDDEDSTGALGDLLSGSWNVISQITPRYNRSEFSADLDHIKARLLQPRRSEIIKGVPLGLEVIDRHIDGIRPGELATVVGFAKTGKTHFLCHSLVAQRRAGFSPFLCSMELGVEDTQDRLAAHLSGLPYGKISKQDLNIEERGILSQSLDEFASLGRVWIEKPPTGERSVQYIVNRAREVGADSLLIDQLSFMESRKQTRERHVQITDIVSELKAEISQDDAQLMPVVLASQFNRESQDKTKGGTSGGELHHIALSASVEQFVDFAFSIHRSEEMRKMKSLGFKIIGTRRTAPGHWLLEWDLDERTRISVRSPYR